MKKLILPLLALASIAIASAQLTPTAVSVKVGSEAPAIKVAKWIKGKPVTSFEKGKVYVVEFWATWCGPCKASIPHLTEMAKKYKGKATFTGVSVWENTKKPDFLDIVAKFVKDFGKKMDYNVAADGLDATMAKTWMTAAGQNGIPTAFVIGKKGTIEWIGHPMAGLEEVVGQVIADKFDSKAAADKQAAEAMAEEEQQTIFKPLSEALMKKDWSTAVAEIDKIIAKDPSKELLLCGTRFTALSNYDTAAATTYAKKISEGVAKNQPMILNELAWTMVDPEKPFKDADYKLALSIALRAVEVTKSQEPNILDTLSVAYDKVGDLAKAIATEEKAIEIAKKTADFPAESLKEFTSRLTEMKSRKK